MDVRRRLHALGIAMTGLLAFHALSSWALAATSPYARDKPFDGQFFGDSAAFWQGLSSWAGAAARGEGALAQPDVWMVTYGLPLALGALLAVALLGWLARHRDALPEDAPRILFRWSVGFGCVCALAVPILTPDFWVYVYWGRMVAEGVNPYHAVPALAFATGLPVNPPRTTMTYGPLWALVSGVLCWLAGGSAIGAAILLKALLLGAWIVSVRLVWRCLEHRSRWHQCAGIAIYGWLPLAVTQTLVDGHNDVIVVVCILAWIAASRGAASVKASLLLAASVMFKYLSAPLFALDGLRSWRGLRRPLLAYWPNALAVGAFTLVGFAIFFRSMSFFGAANRMWRWDFGSPAAAVKAIEAVLGVPVWIAPQLVVFFFAGLGAYAVARYGVAPTDARLRYGVLALIATVLFSATGHVWPWYLTWLLAPAALLPATLLARFSVGIALCGWLPVAVTNTYPYERLEGWPLPTLVVYAGAIAWLLATRGGWLPATDLSEPETAPEAPRSP